MPKTNSGWTIDDSLDFTPNQLETIKKLVIDGKINEADELIEDILASKNQKEEDTDE